MLSCSLSVIFHPLGFKTSPQSQPWSEWVCVNCSGVRTCYVAVLKPFKSKLTVECIVYWDSFLFCLCLAKTWRGKVYFTNDYQCRLIWLFWMSFTKKKKKQKKKKPVLMLFLLLVDSCTVRLPEEEINLKLIHWVASKQEVSSVVLVMHCECTATCLLVLDTVLLYWCLSRSLPHKQESGGYKWVCSVLLLVCLP